MWALKELGELLNKKAATFPLALPALAALTPDYYDIKLIDEESSPIKYIKIPDLVGISSMATNTKRAYEIANKFKKMGSTVVMGGPYTTLNYQESLNHADAVVVGEAEELWGEFLKDFENGSIKKIYKSNQLPDISRLPIPRWDLVDVKKSLSLNVQISRGCPNGCDFCCVTKMFGAKQRYRDIDNVIEEIKSLPVKQLSFVDDNFTSNKKYVKELLMKIKPLHISWNCLASYELGDDEELLNQMADAGCHTILIGFESLNPGSLKVAKKKQHGVSKYEKVVENINRAGIHVTGAFIVGFEEDTLETFDNIYNFYIENNISYIMLNILTAFPNTKLYNNLKKQNRILDIPHNYLTGVFPSMKYDKIGPVDIFNKNLETYRKIYSYDIIMDKVKKIFSEGNYVYPRYGINIKDRISGVANILKRFVFSKNKKKREIIKNIFIMIKNREMTPDLLFEYLFFVEAANIYIDKYNNMKYELQEDIKGFRSKPSKKAMQKSL